MGDRVPLALPPYYTFAELAEVASKSPRRVRRLLDRAGIGYRRMGGKYVVFVSELEEHLPELWESVVTCEQMRAIARSIDEPEGSR